VSFQTGVTPKDGPASQQLGGSARFRVERIKSEPNPIWIRELRQSARLARTPVILAVVTVLVTLLIASIGGIVSAESSPATTGVVLFQVFFSIAYFVVTVVGPAVAANSIASEREGRTWEAVILTGLSPASIAHGKFLAAFTAIGMYVVMLAPVGALPFIFGGVTATETVVAFAFLLLIAALSVAFGLAISSKMASLRAAIVVTLLLIFPISIAAYSVFGFGLGSIAHDTWRGVAEWAPVWLPVAYARAPFGVDYVTFLVLFPIAAVTLPAWFLYEATIASLTSITDDRSTGLKRWFLVTAPTLTAAVAALAWSARPSRQEPAAILGLSALSLFFAFCVFLFAGDPLGPSRRIVVNWDRARAGRLRRFLGPGLARSAWLLLLVGVPAIVLLTIVCTAALHGRPATEGEAVVVLGAYAAAFFTFTVGLGALLRARSSSALTARVMLLGVVFAIAVGPWVVAAIAGLIEGRAAGGHALIIAAPSPFYAFALIANRHDQLDPELAAGLISIVFWAALGLLLLLVAQRRTARAIAQHESALAETDRVLAAEDDAARRAWEAPPDAGFGAPSSTSNAP
jgi:ABC-type transport system involved in multi-copper enzyme maturation permease subunit